MSFFRHIATSRTGLETHVTGITDLAVLKTDNNLHVFSVSGRDGGILARAAGLQITDTETFVPTAGLGADAHIETVVLGGRNALLVSGPAHAGISGFWLGGNGQITGRFDISGPTVEAMTAMEMVEIGNQVYFFTATRGTAGVTAWQQDAQGRLQQVEQVAVALQEDGNDIFALEHVVTGGQTYLMAVSADGNGLHNFRIGASGAMQLVDSLDMSDGLGVSRPTELAQVTLGGQTFMLVGAAGTSSITVVAVRADGTLRATDQVNDDLDTRFQSISVLEAVVVEGRAYVVAGGADDGLSLMTLLPNGRLLHLETIADDLATALTNPSTISLVAHAGKIALYTAGLTDDGFGASGIGRFEIDPHAGGSAGRTVQGSAGADQLGGTAGADLIIGGPGDDRLSGGAGADIIMDGTGADLMWGGAGADIFVLDDDGQTDRILDFELGVDRIDMSQMGRFYTVDALEVRSRGDGADIHINGQVLRIDTADHSRLRAEDFHYSDLTDLWHISTAALPKGDQQIVGAAGNDMILGAEGADTITGGAGRDTIKGGGGDDVILGGSRDDDFDPLAATVFRLYQATLDRDPDAAGHRGWIDILSDGERSLSEVARGFVQSPEFRQNYGDTDNAEFITLLYNNVLDRAPDAGGLAGWRDAMANGASRADVVVGFSESAEFKADTAAGAVSVSMEAYRTDWFDDIYRLYRATLDRAPDAGGLEGWSALLADGMAIGQVAGGFTGSREFQNIYGDLGDAGFVRQLYHNVLDREADANGLKGWVDLLTGGGSRSDVATGFSQSREFIANSTPELEAWVRAQGVEDVLEGGGGRNVLFGGMWSDCFVFNASDGGRHEVADLEVWDQLCFEEFGYATADDVRAHLRQDGEDVVFADQGVEVRLLDTDLEMLRDDDIFDL